MKCHLCGEPAAMTITVATAVRPYRETRSFCAEHGGHMVAIGFTESRTPAAGEPR
jgi:hypothetical protein